MGADKDVLGLRISLSAPNFNRSGDRRVNLELTR